MGRSVARVGILLVLLVLGFAASIVTSSHDFSAAEKAALCLVLIGAAVGSVVLRINARRRAE